MPYRSLASRWIATVALMLATACASTPEDRGKPEICPDWTLMDGGAFPDADKKLFAVGIAQGIQNIQLARQTADNRARTNLQAILNTFVQSVCEDATQSLTDFQNGSSEEQLARCSNRTIVEGTLAGSVIQDRCKDPEADAWYSLAVLDLAKFQALIDQANDLDDALKRAIEQRMNAQLQNMDEILDKTRSMREGE